MVNGQRQPTLVMAAGSPTLLDFVHVGGRHVLEVEVKAVPVGVIDDDPTTAASSPPPACSMSVLAGDGVDFSEPREVRAPASHQPPRTKL